MNPVTQTHTTTGAKTPIALDYLPTSQITAAVTVTGMGTEGFLVQTTLDNVVDPDSDDYVAPASARWFTVASAPTDDTGYIQFNGPWLAIRINISAIDGNTIVFQVGQATTPRA